MSNPTVPAAAEGMPAISRRTFLRSTAGAAAGGIAIMATPSTAAPFLMAELIDAHRAAVALQLACNEISNSASAAVEAEDAAHPVRYETTAGTLTLYEEDCETRSGIAYPRVILEAHWQRRCVANETAYPDDHEQHSQEQRAIAIATGKRDIMASRQLLDADMQSRKEAKARYEARPCWGTYQRAEAQACEADEQEQKAWSRLLSAPCSTLSDVQAKATYLLREANTPEHTIGAGKAASYDALVALLSSLVAAEG